jgi:hypothetical protein
VTVDKFRIDLPMDGFPSDGLMTTTILARRCRSGRRPPHHSPNCLVAVEHRPLQLLFKPWNRAD